MRKKFPKDFDYMPETYAYPEDKKEIEKKFSNYKVDINNLWLVKPKTGSLGEGIYIFENFTKIPDVYLITKYISNPHLINKLKYDFRIYVFITGLSPLKIYLYKEGMIRFATEEYTLDKNHLSEIFRHLTNVNINEKNKKDYKKAQNADTEEGSKWSLQVYQHYCKENNINYNNIRKQMADIAIKSLLSVTT
jgi:tubulin polyglutamylase TTLL4